MKREKISIANVCAVIVTYGNRFHFLKQMIDSALDEGVSKVIVEENFQEVRQAIKELAEVKKKTYICLYKMGTFSNYD